ncbi:MAG: succinate dehydrogenase assembly factor 2 [Hyphomicrobium sp.]
MKTEVETGDIERGILDMRRRRAVWRATHRGTKELDILVGRYAVARLPDMASEELDLFEDFLAVSETDLQGWLLTPGADAGGKFSTLVVAMRRFHGLI